MQGKCRTRSGLGQVEWLELVKNHLFVTEDHVSELPKDAIDSMGKNRGDGGAEEASRKPKN
jgi:hypothetical protein